MTIMTPRTIPIITPIMRSPFRPGPESVLAVWVAVGTVSVLPPTVNVPYAAEYISVIGSGVERERPAIATCSGHSASAPAGLKYTKALGGPFVPGVSPLPCLSAVVKFPVMFLRQKRLERFTISMLVFCARVEAMPRKLSETWLEGGGIWDMVSSTIRLLHLGQFPFVWQCIAILVRV